MKAIRILLVMIVAAVATGCGGGDNGGGDNGDGVAQAGSSITLSPASITTDSSVLNGVVNLTAPFTITVRNSAGSPLRGVRVDIFQDVGTLLDANQVVQTTFPFQAVTDDFGNIRVYVIYQVGAGLSYKGSLETFSGSAFQDAAITVTCSDSGATMCP